jgi:hypothetical protein
MPIKPAGPESGWAVSLIAWAAFTMTFKKA